MKQTLNILFLLNFAIFTPMLGCKKDAGGSGENASKTSAYTPVYEEETQEEKPEEKKKPEGKKEIACSCGAKPTDVMANEVSGITFPLIAQTDPHSYLQFSKDPSPKATYQEGPGVEEITYDVTYEFGKDVNIQKSSGCDVGIYEAQPSEKVRQEIQSCGVGQSSCTTVARKLSLIDGKKLTMSIKDNKVTQSCAWADAPSTWKLYALSQDGMTFQELENDQAFGYLEVNQKNSKGTVSLEHISDDTKHAFSILDDKANVTGKAKDTDLSFALGAHSLDGKNITHVYGYADIDGQRTILVGLPTIKPAVNFSMQ